MSEIKEILPPSQKRNMEISSDLPREVEELLVHLRVVAGIPPDSKLVLHTGSYVSDGIIGNLIRKYYRETKEDMIEHIDKLIGTSVELAVKYPVCRKIIGENLMKISQALDHLQKTYAEYATCASKLEIFKLRITPEAFQKACDR